MAENPYTLKVNCIVGGHLVAGTVPIVHDGSPKIIFESKPFRDFVQFHMFFLVVSKLAQLAARKFPWE
jgi:hypothetical protein